MTKPAPAKPRRSQLPGSLLWALHRPTLDALIEGTFAQAPGRRRETPESEGTTLAAIPLTGLLTKDASIFGDLPEGMRGVRAEVRAAAENPDVGGILLFVDSPGGEVAGVADLAAEVFAARKRKPVVAFVEDLGASGAIWAASQASRVFSNEAALLGSIGVFHVSRDFSDAFEGAGIQTRVVASGEFKGAETMGTKVTDEQLADAQRLVDDVAGLFFKDVARGRNLSVADVKERFGDGRIHPAADSKALGLIDRIGTFDDAVAELSTLAQARPAPRPRETRSGQRDEHAWTLHELRTMLPEEALADDGFIESIDDEATIAKVQRDWKAYKKRAETYQFEPEETEEPTMATESAERRWKAAVAEKLKSGLKRPDAIRAVEREQPGLRAEFVKEFNERHGRRV